MILTLRNTNSPYGDLNKSNILSITEIDNNFIKLKGNDILSGFTTDNKIVLTKFDGSDIELTLMPNFSTYLFAHSTVNPSSGFNYFIGPIQTLTPLSTSRIDRALIMLNSGVIKDVSILRQGLNGSSEGNRFSIFNLTKNETKLITNNVTYTGVDGDNNLYTLEDPMIVDKGDLISIIWEVPNMVELPRQVRNYITINLEN